MGAVVASPGIDGSIAMLQVAMGLPAGLRRGEVLKPSHRANYPGPRKWILDTDVRMKGINHDLVAHQLESENLALKERKALNRLACVPAFLDPWR